MANLTGPVVSTDLLTDLLTRYGRQAIQLFAALAGATGLFYSIGFIIVNVSLLRLGVYETALISVGYVAPGIAFAMLFLLSALGTIGAFVMWRRLLGGGGLRSLSVVLLGVATVVAGAFLLGWAMWFFQNIASGLVVWSIAVNLGIAAMAYAEHLPLINRMLVKRVDETGAALSPARARLNSPPFLIAAFILTFFAVLLYGANVYDQVPPVFGGGLPIVVRFFGRDVGDLDRVGINLEPGETTLTERVELISQTEDRYIVRVANRAVSFDKRFVQGIRYEPPEFFLDPAFFLASHTRQGERFLTDERYDEALSEFNLVLDRNPRYPAALRGRVRILTDELPDFEQALRDYQLLTELEPQRGEHFYELAKVYVQRAQANDQSVEAEPVIAALTSARTISPTLGETARAEPVFEPLLDNKTFIVAVYGSGPDAARWFAEHAKSKVESGATDEAVAAYQRAIDYAGRYSGEPGALTKADVAAWRAALSRLYDPISSEALDELEAAVEDSNGSPDYLIELARLYLQRGDTAMAQEVYDRALSRLTASDPNRLQVLLGLGQTRFRNRDYLGASAAFKQALALSEADASTWYDYARALATLGDSETEAALRKAIALDSSLAERALTVDWVDYFSKVGTSVENLIKGAAATYRARSLRNQGDIAGAIAAYQGAVAADPSVAAYWRELGEVLAEASAQAQPGAQRYVEAIAAYKNAIARIVEPAELPDALNDLAEVQLAADDYAGAIDSFKQSINIRAGAATATLYARLARAYELNAQYADAAGAYDQAALRDASNKEYPYRSGINLMLAGQIEQGLEKLKPTIDQGGLRVESTDLAELRPEPSAGAVLKSLTVGEPLLIQGNPQVSEGAVWWPVQTLAGETGWVRADSVVPAQPSANLFAPVTQQPPPAAP